MGKSTYNKEWEKERPWVKPVFGDKHSLHCAYCKRNYKLENKGTKAVTDHESTDKHKNNAAAYSGGQREFNSEGILPPSAAHTFTKEELIAKAEIIEAFNTVETNRSFQSANNDSSRFASMFPNDPIAQGYSQGESKMKYNIQFGLAPYIKETLKKDYMNKAFTFKFDETTTEQVKKQYDAYITFFSDAIQLIKTFYCGSLFVGHCTAEDLLEHFLHFIKELGLDVNFLVNIGMDGPNVNRKFEASLQTHLEKTYNTSFFSIGSCNLHTVNNSFGKGMDFFKKENIIDLDQFAIDLHFFFKLSAARREDYRKTSEVTEITAAYMMKHIQVRWLSIEKVLVRIIEQYDNLKEYFLEAVPRQKNFKKDIKETVRYKRISQLLNSHLTLLYMAFVVHTSLVFREFMLIFQADAPMIHLLHPKMVGLLKAVVGKFVEEKHIKSQVKHLLELKLKDAKLHKQRCDIGSKALSLMAKLDAVQSKQFYENTKNFLIRCAEYLQTKLPINEQVLYDVTALNPLNKKSENGTNSIRRLSTAVVKCLGNRAKDLFQYHGEDYQLVDLVMKEHAEYVLEDIPKSYYKHEITNDNKEGRQQRSYWSNAFEVAGSKNPKKEPSTLKRVDEYWRNVEGIVDCNGVKKYFHLCTVAKCLLTLSHGNAEPERGFSLNKFLLKTHGTTIDSETIVALRYVKDYVHHCGGTNNILITKELIKSSLSASSRYDLFLEERRKEKKIREGQEAKEAAEIEAAEKQGKEKKEKEAKNKEIKENIDMFQNCIEVADNTITTASEEMGKMLNGGKQLITKDLKLLQAKMDMGLKRKAECQHELSELKVKLSKLSKLKKQ